jgi:putative hydrolase
MPERRGAVPAVIYDNLYISRAHFYEKSSIGRTYAYGGIRACSKIHIISHPGDGSCELDFERLVLAAKETHTLLEVNNHSLAPQRKKTVARDINLEILRLCKKYEVPTILGSDAHISFQIADYERLYPLLKETDFPDELIMNYWPDKFFDYLGIQR